MSHFANEDLLRYMYTTYMLVDDKISAVLFKLRDRAPTEMWLSQRRVYEINAHVQKDVDAYLKEGFDEHGKPIQGITAALDHFYFLHCSNYTNMLPQFHKDNADGKNLAVLWCAPMTSFEHDTQNWQNVYTDHQEVRDVFARGLRMSYLLNDIGRSPTVWDFNQQHLPLAARNMPLEDTTLEPLVFQQLLKDWIEQAKRELEPYTHVLKIVPAFCYEQDGQPICIRMRDQHILSTHLQFLMPEPEASKFANILDCYIQTDTMRIAWIPYRTENALLYAEPDAREQLHTLHTHALQGALDVANTLVKTWHTEMDIAARTQAQLDSRDATRRKDKNVTFAHSARDTHTRAVVSKADHTLATLFTASAQQTTQSKPEPEPAPEPEPEPMPEPEPAPEQKPVPVVYFTGPEPEPEPADDYYTDTTHIAHNARNDVTEYHPHCVQEPYSRTILWLSIKRPRICRYFPGAFVQNRRNDVQNYQDLLEALGSDHSLENAAKLVDSVRYALKFQNGDTRNPKIDAWIDRAYTETYLNPSTYTTDKPTEHTHSFHDQNIDFYLQTNATGNTDSEDPQWVLACNCKRNPSTQAILDTPCFISHETLQRSIEDSKLQDARSKALKQYIRKYLLYDVDEDQVLTQEGATATQDPALISCIIASAYLHDLQHIALTVQRYAIKYVPVTAFGIQTSSRTTLLQYAIHLCGSYS